MRRNHSSSCLWGLAMASSLWLGGQAAAGEASALRLVPFPKEVQLRDGSFALDRPLVLTGEVGRVELFAQMIGAELTRAGLKPPSVHAIEPEPNAQMPCALSLAPKDSGRYPKPAFRPKPTPEDYVVEIGPESTGLGAWGNEGLLYAVGTLCQLIRANRQGNAIPCMAIKDWPSLRWRCYQDDLTRGPSSTFDELKREIDLGAYLKQNLFTYYMESQFAFQKHPVIGPKDGSLLPEELKALVAYGQPLGVGILGNQQSFGHFEHILKHKEFEPLRETAWILSPVNEDSYKLLDDMYSEVVPLLPLPFFNVCCDETQGLGKGPSKALAEKIGEGGVYAQHLKRIHDLLKEKYGKRMMMWGDIILGHPKDLKSIPTDTIMLTWGYHPGANFEGQIVPFAKSGYEFFVCPGVNNWGRILPDFADAMVNIRNFVRDGAKHGTLGMLNTAWDDDGETLNAPNWHGIAWGAECSWNASTTSPEDFNRRIGAVLFGEKGDHFGQAIALLAKTHRLPGMQGMGDGRFWELDFGAVKMSVKAARASAEKLLAIVRPAIEHLDACRKEATANAELLDAFLFGARRMELIGTRMLDGLDAAAAYSAAYEGPLAEAAPHLAKAEALLCKNRDAHAALCEEFKRLWQRENRPYALDWTTKKYDRAVAAYEALGKRLAAASESAKAGKPIPSPKEMGLELLELGVRRTQPHKIIPTPLQPDAPWADPTATHRFSLVVKAGTVDRTDLPLEVDLRLAAELASKPVRAFAAVEGKEPREIPAQVDPTDNPDHARLTLLLEGPLPKGSSAPITVYLGLPKAGPPLPQAASTSDAPKGAKWLENDKVKLLLGPEGAHLYRWEVRPAANRDLTMPGETGWFGFCDLGGEHRSARNTLRCIARGPALVRYVCTDEQGMVKIISLFAGASWVEVTLSSPVGYYWDFDDPKNFSADGPTPGRYLFSNGAAGAVGRLAGGVSEQVPAHGVHWAIKYIVGGMALGMVSPEAATMLVAAPGSGAGGVGLGGGPPAAHFVTYGGPLPGDPRDLMTRLHQTLDFRNPPEIILHAVQSR